MKNNKKLRVYTITFHRANNYGAMLQAYALQSFLKTRYDTKIVDYDNVKIYDYYRLIIASSKNIFKIIKHIIPRIVGIISNIQREKEFNKFRKTLKLTNYYKGITELKEKFEDCDVLITGSDQVWNPGITVGYDDGFFLNFGKESIRRISYAASCGDIKKIDIKELYKRISNFEGISVREQELLDLIKNNTKLNPHLVCDPTLLLEKDKWLKLIGSERIVKEKYIMCYSVGNANKLYYDCVNKLAKKYGFLVVFFDKNCCQIKVRKKSFYKVGPNAFLNLLFYSEFCVTTSFHGVALASILNIKFFAIMSSYSNRLLTLLDVINLKNRIVDSVDNLDIIDNSQINWEMTNKNIENYSNKSAEWLLSTIEGDANE